MRTNTPALLRVIQQVSRLQVRAPPHLLAGRALRWTESEVRPAAITPKDSATTVAAMANVAARLGVLAQDLDAPINPPNILHSRIVIPTAWIAGARWKEIYVAVQKKKKASSGRNSCGGGGGGGIDSGSGSDGSDKRDAQKEDNIGHPYHKSAIFAGGKGDGGGGGDGGDGGDSSKHITLASNKVIVIAVMSIGAADPDVFARAATACILAGANVLELRCDKANATGELLAAACVCARAVARGTGTLSPHTVGLRLCVTEAVPTADVLGWTCAIARELGSAYIAAGMMRLAGRNLRARMASGATATAAATAAAAAAAAAASAVASSAAATKVPMVSALADKKKSPGTPLPPLTPMLIQPMPGFGTTLVAQGTTVGAVATITAAIETTNTAQTTQPLQARDQNRTANSPLDAVKGYAVADVGGPAIQAMKTVP